ncbi:MAG: hypothetical protein U0003_01825 [Vampirovibrionales bacterium]
MNAVVHAAPIRPRHSLQEGLSTMTADRDRDITPFLEEVRRARTARYEAQFGPLSPLLCPQPFSGSSNTTSRRASASKTQPKQRSANAQLAQTLGQQWLTHQQLLDKTNRVFDELLTHLEAHCDDIRQELAQWLRKASSRDAFSQLPRRQSDIQRQLYARVDADRSVGIINLLWHTLSFSVRGNTRPLALFSPQSYTSATTAQQAHNQPPQWCGRIVAFLGDFLELTEDNPLHDFNELLPYEVASLYVPLEGPMVMRHHHSDDTLELPAGGEIEIFLRTVVTTVCLGGYFHEREDRL